MTTTPIAIATASSDADIARAFPVMVQLRPHLRRETFVALVRRLETRGYHLVTLSDGDAVRAAAGFRIVERLLGRVLHVDDLVTDEAYRGGGWGTRLLAWLRERATEQACVRLELDSANHRQAAHAFYRSRGMVDRSLHFTMELT